MDFTTMKTNILIPMAGEGKRFKEAGYTQSKPMILVDGRPMIERVYDNIGADGFFFVAVPEEIKIKVMMLSLPGGYVSIRAKTEGPACTALAAKTMINNNIDLLIANCDQLVFDFSLDAIKVFARIHEADVILGCFISTSPKNSYVRLNDDGQIIEVREKEVISNIATNGLHWFRRGSDFVRGAEKMIEADDRVNGEFYIAPSVNYLIAEGLKVMPFFFNLHFPIGTPEDLQKYESIHSKINQ